jgi:thiaminase
MMLLKYYLIKNINYLIPYSKLFSILSNKFKHLLLRNIIYHINQIL